MVRVFLNGDGETILWDLVKYYIQPELLDDPTISAELKDVEKVYKREGLAMYTDGWGVKSPSDLGNGTKALILFTCFDKHKVLISSACCGANVAKYIPSITKKYDFDMALDYFLDLPDDAEIDAVDADTGFIMKTGKEFKYYYAGRAGTPEVL